LNVAVFTLGLSPPIAVEFLLGLSNRGIKCDRGIAIITKGAAPSFQALKIALHWSSKATNLFPFLSKDVLVKDLSYVSLFSKKIVIDDIARPRDCQTFRVQFNSALRDAIKWAGEDVSKVYVCVAGGRKTIPIDATLISIAEGIRNVYHVIAPKIPGIAGEFANLVAGKIDEVEVGDKILPRRVLLEKLSKFAEKPWETEKDLIKYSLTLCFPPRNLEFYLVKIPIPRLSLEERKRFREEVLS